MNIVHWFLNLPKNIRIISIASACTVIVGTGVGIGVGVGLSKPEHTHSFSETVLNEATCQANGTKRYVCEECEYGYSEEYSLPVFNANEIYEKNKDSIGEIITYDRHNDELSLGTGFVYSADGKIITNYHVIDDAYSAKVKINGMSYVVQSILAYDKDIDLAVLKINADGLSVPTICYKEHSVGTEVYTIGSSKGLTDTFSSGMITYANREIDEVQYVQHNAAISNGNSGGPLLNRYGEVIGINTMTVKESQNLNFAISVKELSNLLYGTPLTVAEFYEKECDTFLKVKNYLRQEGTYDRKNDRYVVDFEEINDSGLTFSTSGYYYVGEDKIELVGYFTNHTKGAMTFITIDSVDGVYDWDYIDSDNSYICGTLYAATWTPDSLLGVTRYSGISVADQASYREIASKMISLTVYCITYNYADIDVSAADFGFVHPDFAV